MSKQRRKIEQWLEIAILHKLLTVDEAANMKVNIDNPGEGIVKEDDAEELRDLLQMFFWDDTKEKDEYWQQIDYRLAASHKYHYLNLMLKFFATSVIIENVEMLAKTYMPFGDITTNNDDALYARALLAVCEERTTADLFSVLSPSDVVIIKSALNDVEGKEVKDDSIVD